MNAQNKQQLQTLHALYPTREEAAAEVARLSAAAHLPKETEFFVSDIHGEFAAFSHILRNASGGIRELIDFVFEDGLSEDKKRTGSLRSSIIPKSAWPLMPKPRSTNRPIISVPSLNWSRSRTRSCCVIRPSA